MLYRWKVLENGKCNLKVILILKFLSKKKFGHILKVCGILGVEFHSLVYVNINVRLMGDAKRKGTLLYSEMARIS